MKADALQEHDASDRPMISVSAARSGKSHRDENFPVASVLIRYENRRPILAFYRFVRAADDVADHPALSADEKLALLDHLENALTGAGSPDREAEPLRVALAERGLSAGHALDLLEAFRLDARKARYADWSDLMDYCALSAMPVGRFVLDVHGEARTTWPASDALCKALQVLNHLQDCAKDYRTLDRVYLPADILASHGIGVEALGAPTASPALRACLAHLSDRSAQLVRDSTPLPNLIADWRLGLEVAAIQRLAATLLERLKHRDPLGEPVHLGRAGFVTTAAIGAMGGLIRRLIRKHPARVSEETRL